MSISQIGAAVYIGCATIFFTVVCFLFLLGMTPCQRYFHFKCQEFCTGANSIITLGLDPFIQFSWKWSKLCHSVKTDVISHLKEFNRKRSSFFPSNIEFVLYFLLYMQEGTVYLGMYSLFNGVQNELRKIPSAISSSFNSICQLL